MLRTTVIDTGQGIPLEKRDKLFRLFESIDDQQSNLITTSGIGLGLAICNQLTQKLGGELTLPVLDDK